jgi:hypothetical protein
LCPLGVAQEKTSIIGSLLLRFELIMCHFR